MFTHGTRLQVGARVLSAVALLYVAIDVGRELGRRESADELSVEERREALRLFRESCEEQGLQAEACRFSPGAMACSCGRPLNVGVGPAVVRRPR